LIRPLRRVHRRVSIALALVLPAVLIAAVAARPDWGPPEADETEPDHVRFTQQHFEYFQLDGVRLRLAITAGDEQFVAVQCEDGLPFPDVLLYATDAAVEDGAALPDDAVLIGALRGRETDEFAVVPGSVRARYVLYSLAHHAIVGSVATPTID
jgi:hypothetical protein